MPATQTETDHALDNAKAWLESIIADVAAFNAATEAEDHDKAEELREAMLDGPLSLQVRGGWYQPGDDDKGGAPEEFELLLSTGGPALRIVGDLGEWGSPNEPRLQHQDWFKPWTDYATTTEEDEALETYCGFFYFGEG